MFCSKAASSCPTVCFCWRDQDLLVPRRGHRHRVVVPGHQGNRRLQGRKAGFSG